MRSEFSGYQRNFRTINLNGALHHKSEPPAAAGGLSIESLKIDLNVSNANLQPSATADGSDF